jgi:NADH dehydrogenase [ubiquinone] 1 alpha subcomplex assembly factor 7
MADSKTDDSQALETEIRRRITGAGPMPVGQYMALCLTDPEHGYYMQRDPLGARGDWASRTHCG